VSRGMNFLTHHVGMMSLLQHKIISSIISNLKHNKAILTLHFIHGPKEHNSFISPYLCTYHLNNSSTTEVNYNTQTQLFVLNTINRTNPRIQTSHHSRMPLAEVSRQTHLNHPSMMPLAEAIHQSQPDHPSRMSLAEVNHKTQPGHPSKMPLAEANHQSQPGLHLGCH
jgi:hypothetical protein